MRLGRRGLGRPRLELQAISRKEIGISVFRMRHSMLRSRRVIPVLQLSRTFWYRTIGTLFRVSPTLVSDGELLERLTGVFRRHGYDGASLSVIAAATGLQRSSLYHRFPGGKEQMAAEVARALGGHFGSQVLARLGGDEPVGDRLAAVAQALHQFYDGGGAGCLLDILTLGSPGSATTEALAEAARAWIGAFAAAARQAGFAPADARRRAEDAIAAIEGGLVLARVTGDRKPFHRAVQRLAPTLTGKEAA